MAQNIMFSVNARCSYFCVLVLTSHVPLYGGHSLPSREDLEGPEKPSKLLRDPAQGRAGRPGPPVLQAVPAGLADGP